MIIFAPKIPRPPRHCVCYVNIRQTQAHIYIKYIHYTYMHVKTSHEPYERRKFHMDSLAAFAL